MGDFEDFIKLVKNNFSLAKENTMSPKQITKKLKIPFLKFIMKLFKKILKIKACN